MSDVLETERDIFAELAKAKDDPSNPGNVKVRDDFSASPDDAGGLGAMEEIGGQLTIDVFQDEDHIYVQSAVAGVDPDSLDVHITKESVSVKGKRERTHKVTEKDFFYQECFWGAFSRSVVLPEEVDPDKSVASLKNGILTVKMPKLSGKRHSKSIKVKTD